MGNICGTTDPNTATLIKHSVRLISARLQEENDVGEFYLSLEKDPQQEEFLQGRMQGNPYPSSTAGLGPLMRDVKNKICTGEWVDWEGGREGGREGKGGKEGWQVDAEGRGKEGGREGEGRKVGGSERKEGEGVGKKATCRKYLHAHTHTHTHTLTHTHAHTHTHTHTHTTHAQTVS